MPAGVFTDLNRSPVGDIAAVDRSPKGASQQMLVTSGRCDPHPVGLITGKVL